MSSAEIRTLLQPPNTKDSDARALAYINSTYKSLEDLESGPDLDELVEQARQKLEGLETEVRHHILALRREHLSSHPPQLSSRTRRGHWTM